MRSSHVVVAFGLLVASGALLTACGGGSSGSIPTGQQETTQSASRSSSASSSSSDTDWAYYNNDLKGQRFSSLTGITASNVQNLHPICSYTVPSPNPVPYTGLNFETGPIVVKGTMYFSTISDTYAIGASNCRLIWDTHRTSPGGGLANRGVAYDNGMIFKGTLDGHVVAMNATSGKPLWDVSIASAPENFTAAPIAWHNLIFIGTSGAESGAQCHVYAIDERSGAVVWKFQTVPSDGSSIANWQDTTGEATTHPAGGSTWSTYTIDPSNAVLYVSTGNPGPDFDDRDRMGSDNYTDSVIALNAFTGALLNSYSLVPHDVHDWDMAAAPVVASGGPNTQVLAGGKDGYVYAINPRSGALNWHTPITTVAPDAVPVPGSPMTFCPGTTGGVEWNGPAYSPVLNTVYSNGVDNCATDIVEETTFTPFTPSALGACEGLWVGVSPCTSLGIPSSIKKGYITALDASTGNVVWKYTSTTPMIAGVTVTASGLVFTGDLKGNILVFDAVSGTELKSIATNEPIGGGVISYGIGGKQYVAVAAGINSTYIWTPGTSSPASIVVLGI